MTQTGNLKNKVAVVTGGAKGIGRAVVTALVERGATVVVGDLLDKEGQALVDDLNSKFGNKVAVFVHTDVTSWADNKKIFAVAEERFGGVDNLQFVFHTNIAWGFNTLLAPLGESKILQVNLDGVIKGNKVAILHLAKRGGGVIMNTASVAGFLCSSLLPYYTASKHAVVGWTRSLDAMKDVANVRVNADILSGMVAPGTEFLGKCPKVPMATVVDAFMSAIEDDSRHESCISEEMVKSLMTSYPEQIKGMKADLEQALLRAKI
ncbi:hypothetical protein Unana1_04055 [Umbelopsis nana]